MNHEHFLNKTKTHIKDINYYKLIYYLFNVKIKL